MKIKEIVFTALRLLGRGEVAAALEDGEALSKEATGTEESLLYCVNAVIDELARYYFPLVHREQLDLISGKVNFSRFAFRPVKILSVTANGKKSEYKVYPQYLTADGATAEVEYEYAPDKKGLEDDCDYAGFDVSERLIADGAVAEFCILNGEVSAAEYWEGEYRREIDRARAKYRRAAKIPPRRWV